MPQNPNHTPSLTVRLKPELRAKLEADAEAGYRSLTMQLVMIIEQHYATKGRDNA